MVSRQRFSVFVCMFFIMLALVVNGIIRVRDAKEADYTSVVAEEKIEERSYTLKLHKGKIAVFKDGVDSPIMITDISEHTLRTFDREQLTKGISIENDVELARILEDFGS